MKMLKMSIKTAELALLLLEEGEKARVTRIEAPARSGSEILSHFSFPTVFCITKCKILRFYDSKMWRLSVFTDTQSFYAFVNDGKQITAIGRCMSE